MYIYIHIYTYTYTYTHTHTYNATERRSVEPSGGQAHVT